MNNSNITQAQPLNFPRVSALNANTPNSVSARELYQFLEVRRDFSNWIKARIEDYGFVENEDFVLFANSGEKSFMSFGRPKREYFVSLDMAKELAMVERNHKGRLARRHFIAVEKKALQQHLNIAQVKQELLRANPTWQKITRYKAMGLNNVEIAKLLGVYKSNVGRTLRRMEQCGIIEPPANLFKMQQQAQRLRLARGVA